MCVFPMCNPRNVLRFLCVPDILFGYAVVSRFIGAVRCGTQTAASRRLGVASVGPPT